MTNNQEKCIKCEQIHQQGEDCYQAVVRNLCPPSVAKVYPVGNSTVLTLPAEHVKRLGLKPGVEGENLVEINFWKVKKVDKDES